MNGKNSSHWRNLMRYTSASLGVGSGSRSLSSGRGAVCPRMLEERGCDVVAASASESSLLTYGWQLDDAVDAEDMSHADTPFIEGGADGGWCGCWRWLT